VWSNVYRTSTSVPHGTTRPIFANTCNVKSPANEPLILGPGQYWVDWMCAGSLASGPWAPPISIWNATITGDALQYTTGWALAIDTGTSQASQGMPFIIDGTLPSPVAASTWTGIKALYR